MLRPMDVLGIQQVPNGSSTDPWSIEYAMESATLSAGDTVYIKNGVYVRTNDDGDWIDENGNVVTNITNAAPLTISISRTGTSTSPIVFAGYYGGSTGNSPVPPSTSGGYNYSLYALHFPTLNTFDREGATDDGLTAITLSSCDHVEIHGIHITNYSKGVSVSGGEGNDLADLLIVDLGYATPGSLPYKGHGIIVYNSPDSTVDNCFVMDTEAEGITVKGDDVTVTSCDVYNTGYFDPKYTGGSTVGRNRGMDYCYLIAASSLDTSGNIIEDCYAEQEASTEKPDHGYAFVNLPGHTVSAMTL